MKKRLIVAIGTAIALSSTTTFAESKIEKSTIKVNSNNKNATALSLGKDSTAAVGSVVIKDSKIKKSRITVNSNNKNATALSLGKGSTAAVGSVVVE